MNIFVWKLSKIAAQKKVFILPFFTFEVPFNGLFAPTSRSRMLNIFRDSEFLGKSNGKKWSNIWIFLFGSGQKLPRKKKFFLLLILPYKTWWKPRFHPPMASVLLSASVERCFVSHMQDFYLEIPRIPLWNQYQIRKTLTAYFLLLHKLRELSHLSSIMKIALATKAVCLHWPVDKIRNFEDKKVFVKLIITPLPQPPPGLRECVTSMIFQGLLVFFCLAGLEGGPQLKVLSQFFSSFQQIFFSTTSWWLVINGKKFLLVQRYNC